MFSEVVVPSHRLVSKFNVIINSSDYRELDKTVLWPIAFKTLGDGIQFENSLLIEDGPKEPALFRKCGGFAHQYVDDGQLVEWLDATGFEIQ